LYVSFQNKGHEREIKDLQREFETERTDYLETIRRHEKQLKLYQQITAKMSTSLKQECNYRFVAIMFYMIIVI
jgi:hypothetical protein